MKVTYSTVAVVLLVLIALTQPALGGLRLMMSYPPCRNGQVPTLGAKCIGRFQPCGTEASKGNPMRAATITPYSGAECHWYTVDPYNKRWYIVQFTGKAQNGHKCMEILMQSGECW